MTSADHPLTWQMTSPRADVSRGTLAHGGAWQRMEARGGAWRKLEARACDTETSGGAWGHVGGLMKTKFHRK